MAPGGEYIDYHSEHYQARAKPERNAVRLRLGSGLPDPQGLQKEAEARDNKTKPHERKTGPNPGQKSSFRGQIVARSAGSSLRHLFTVSTV